MQELTLGSLFDGIGGFCYAACLTGRIKPIWAAEIEANCIGITRYRFPEVMHVGNVRELKGDEIQPVDIITFGSPCQDLSIAGKQKGLKGSRSGLFMEAVRIIEEMRSVTNGKYPTFIIWENVPGAFSSGGGADFRTVLEKITKASIPMPPSGRWADAGMVRGAAADAAWRVLDAQHWGTPQRRKRIYLIGDFRGQRAGEILFKPESLLGYTPKGKDQKQEIAGQFADSVRTELTTADVHSVFYEAYQHSGYRESKISGTITANHTKMVTGSTPLVVRTDRKTFELNQHGGYRESEVNGTLRAAGGDCGGGTETIVTEKYRERENIHSRPESIKDILKRAVQKVTYVIRRLTPVECERLQGYPDNWTKYGADGTEIADTARYKAIGNSICVYCAERVYRGILDALEEETDNGRG